METGTILVGRYLIERHLSKGGQGNVYLAQDLRLSNRLCAVKRVQATLDLTDTKAQVAQNLFQSEAAMLAQLKHANLPIIYDFFTEADASYLVMEFVPGKTLQSILEQHPKGLPEAQVVEWANQLVTVLQYLHNQNPPIVFRDLKPANVMLDKDDKIKLIDFGIARHFKTENSRDTVVAGTPGYLSPEGYGREQTDTRTDVYSLGVLLIVLLTGINPSSYGFSIPNPRKIRSDISVGLDHTLARAIALKKEDRYQAMADFAQALQNRVIIEERTVVGFMPNPDLTTTILDRPAPVVVPAVIPVPEGQKRTKLAWIWGVGAGLITAIMFLAISLAINKSNEQAKNKDFVNNAIQSPVASNLADSEQNIRVEQTQIVVVIHITATYAPTKTVPTPLPSNTPLSTDIPFINSAYLTIGSVAKVSNNVPEVNLRRSPGSVNKPSTDLITKIPKGERVHIIGGPEAIFGKNWWEVEWNDYRGWMAEDTTEKGVILVPVLQSSYCSSLNINVGDIVQVASNISSGLSVRKSPGYLLKNDEVDIIASFPIDAVTRVVGGPEYADDGVWWEIDYQGIQGWVAESSQSKGRALYACD
jgi:serine/threonine protein kinase